MGIEILLLRVDHARRGVLLDFDIRGAEGLVQAERTLQLRLREQHQHHVEEIIDGQDARGFMTEPLRPSLFSMATCLKVSFVTK